MRTWSTIIGYCDTYTSIILRLHGRALAFLRGAGALLLEKSQHLRYGAYLKKYAVEGHTLPSLPPEPRKIKKSTFFCMEINIDIEKKNVL